MTFLRTALNAQRKARGEAELNAADVPAAGAREGEGARHRRRDAEAPGQRRLLRRREEAQRDPADGGAGAADVHPRRDRLRPRRRRDEAGGRGGERAARARPRLPRHHPLPAAARPYPPDVVHIMADGRIVQSGGPELALEVETNGYADILGRWRDGDGGPGPEARRRRRRCSPPGPSPRGEAAWAAAARAPAPRGGCASAARRCGATNTGASPTRPSLTAQPAPGGGAARPTRRRSSRRSTRLRLVFVDGVFAPERSDAPALAGVEITPLAEVLRTDIHWARELFGVLEARGQDPVDRPLAALNTARATRGRRDPGDRPAASGRCSFVYLRERRGRRRAGPPRDPARCGRRPDAARERRRRGAVQQR